MVKKEFTEWKMEVVVFDTRDVIATSGFEGAKDEFFDENGNLVTPSSGDGE